MSFINSYRRLGQSGQSITDSFSKSFIENGSTYIYSVYRDAQGICILSKINITGAIIWQKRLPFFVTYCHNIEQMTDNNTSCYIMACSNELFVPSESDDIRVVKFNPDGELLFHKEIPRPSLNSRSVWAYAYNNSFFLFFSDVDQQVKILELNIDGAVLSCKGIADLGNSSDLGSSNFYMDTTSGEMLAVGGDFLDENQRGFNFIHFDQDSIINTVSVVISDSDFPNSILLGNIILTKVEGKTCIYFSFDSEGLNSQGTVIRIRYVGLISYDNSGVASCKIINTLQNSVGIEGGNELAVDANKNVYLTYRSQVIKFSDINLEPLWVKSFTPSGITLRNLVYSPQTNHFNSHERTFTNNSNTVFPFNSRVFHLNLDLVSCITSNEEIPNYPEIVYTPSVHMHGDIVDRTVPSIIDRSVNNAINVVSNVEEICPPQQIVDLEQSTIEAEPTQILANGSSQSEITVQLNDANGFPIAPGGSYQVTILNLNNVGTLTVPTGTTNEEGEYTTQLISSTTVDTALLGFSVAGIGVGTDQATVEFIQPGPTIDITDNTLLQSPHLYLQAAGSNGEESTLGRHLRWALKGALGEKHLPKGDYAQTNVNFNKSQDFVRIYRAAYTRKTITLNFIEQAPVAVDNTNYLWRYVVEEKEFYLRFGNTAKYDQVLTSINPLSQAVQFLIAYGNELIELESITDLFFTATCHFNSTISGGSTSVRLETLSVESNSPITGKVVSNRRHLQNAQIGNFHRLVCENGKVIRGITSGVLIGSVDFEFYSEFINEINATTGWDELGDYALTLHNGTAFKQLEPAPGDVHGVWERFNDKAYVNIKNYYNKWNGSAELEDRNIKQVVGQYIALSNDSNNPTAIESVPLGNDPNDPGDFVDISHLDLLNTAAHDYHIARMLGLGILDIDKPSLFKIKTENGKQQSIEAYKKPRYIYVAEYYTSGDLEDGQGARDVHHLFVSLPTSNNDSRLPVPVNLSNFIPGVFVGTGSGQPLPLTDEDGYTHDGLSRYISLYNQSIPDDEIDVPFFNSSNLIDLSKKTSSVYGGLEYRKNGAIQWQKPELAKDIRYENTVPSGEEPHFETRFIVIPSIPTPYYIHRQTTNGTHYYSSYGINWFSRATSSDTIIAIQTELRPQNPLLPPSNTLAHLIRSESPLLLTSASEQERLQAINPNGDRTLIRLSFDYHTYHELKNYQVPFDDTTTNLELINDADSVYPDDDEIFAEDVDIFFRNQVPNQVTGKALTVTDHSSEETLSIIQTGDYAVASTGQTLIPVVTPGTEQNYIGGFFIMGNDRYLIQEVTQSAQGPKFTVYKREITESIVQGGMPSDQTDGELLPPEIIGDGYFMAFENMQTPDNWGSPNPHSFEVKVGIHNDIHREVITLVDDEGVESRYLEKTRGIWSDSTANHTTVESLNENGDVTAQHTGLYKITFHNIKLHEHPQYSENGISVEWSGGIIRLFTEGTIVSANPNGSRKVLPVLKIDHIVRPNQISPIEDVVVYAQDTAFNPNDNDYDPVRTGTNIEANCYPGYKIYLYADSDFGLTEEHILPEQDEGTRYSIFGFRSHDIDDNFVSKISIPAVMFAQELIEALPPEQPEGALYATRPDFFGRSTYTLTTKYQHRPHGVLSYRSNDEALLNALYEKDTVLAIREELAILGGNDEEYLTNRWENFLDFNQLEMDGDYKAYPPQEVSEDGYKFPNPDKQALYTWANSILERLGQSPITESPGDLAVGDPKILEFVKGYLYNTFVPLTEIPVLYQYLNDEDYQPISKKQTIYDRNGHTLPPVDPKTVEPGDEQPEFDMAPMMKIIDEAPHETLFTDFTLDGTSKNLYFYGVKELSTQMKMSDFSPFLGPIKLVNTNAPEAPEIKRIMPVLENEVLGITPAIQLEVNAYPEVQNVKKLTIYRATSRLEAQSVRTMDVVKIVDLEAENLLGNSIWTVTDAFDDLSEVPYGAALFYRITASREVEYADKDGNIVTEYAPSKASKSVISAIVEVSVPSSPVLRFLSTAPDAQNQISQVSLVWDKVGFNSRYHVYKMNNQGNWVKIHQLQSNEDEIALSLAETDLASDTLEVTDQNGNPRYHHFKVTTENTAGMLSVEEHILTIFNENDWTEV